MKNNTQQHVLNGGHDQPPAANGMAMSLSDPDNYLRNKLSKHGWTSKGKPAQSHPALQPKAGDPHAPDQGTAATESSVAVGSAQLMGRHSSWEYLCA